MDYFVLRFDHSYRKEDISCAEQARQSRINAQVAQPHHVRIRLRGLGLLGFLSGSGVSCSDVCREMIRSDCNAAGSYGGL